MERYIADIAQAEADGYLEIVIHNGITGGCLANFNMKVEQTNLHTGASRGLTREALFAIRA